MTQGTMARTGISGWIGCMLAMLICLALPLPAQNITGSIYGTVTDITEAVVPGSNVEVRNIATGEIRQTQANGSGNYLVNSLVPGNYTVTTKSAGFQPMVQNGITLAANQNVQASFTLVPGSADATITVDAGAQLIETRSSQLGQTVTQEQIQDLPLNGRDAYSLVQLVPGVTGFSAGPAIGNNTGATFSTNGLRIYFNSYYLDGAYDGTLFRGGGAVIPNPEALQEFRVLTSNFDSEFGRTPGGVVNIITRSGTNKFHGSAYDYLRNNIFNAKNYFSTTSVAPLHQNQFGAAIGGPVLRDKLFFFAAYQGLRIHAPTQIFGRTVYVGTLAERSGDFRASTIKATGTSCLGVVSVVCSSAFDPVAVSILKYVPAGDSNGYAPEQTLASNTSADQGLARLDYQLNDAHKLQLSFFEQQGSGFNRTIAGNQVLGFSGDTLFGQQLNGVVGDTWIVSPTMVNTARAYYSLAKSVQDNAHPEISLQSLGSQLVEPTAGVGHSQPLLTVAGYFTAGNSGSGPLNQSQSALGINDTLQWSKGNHSIKVGGSFIWFKYAETASASGSATFASGSSTSTTNNALADFLTGHSAAFIQQNGGFHRLHAADPSLYAQDDWRATRRLTLNLGVRWEVYPPFTGENNFGTFVRGAKSTRFPTAPLGLLSSGDPGIPDGILHTSYTKFTPRVGFAMDVFGDGKTSLRGAYGIFYAASQETFVGNLEQQPFKLSVTLNKTPSLVNPYSNTVGGNPFPYAFNPASPRFNAAATLSGLHPNKLENVPYVHEYNLTVEQQFGRNMSTRIAYVGNQSRKFYYARDQNAAIYTAGAVAGSAAARRPITGYGQINMLDSAANANYNALQTSLQFKASESLTLSANYTWSKNMDFVSADPGSFANFTLADQYDLRRDYGLSSLHVPHRFVVSFLYHLPPVKRFGVVGTQLLSGWQINGITTAQSGSPVNILSGVDSNADTIATDRPNMLRDPAIRDRSRSRTAKISQWFDTTAFARVGTNVPYGNAHRNAVLGPGSFSTDGSVFKSFLLARETNLQFRAEVFNLFNNVNLGNPNGSLSATAFGRITSADPARVMQLSLKVNF